MLGVMTTPAWGYGYDFKRTCDGEVTTYSVYTSSDGDYAETSKDEGMWASCAGHAWVRIKMAGSWMAWKSDPYHAKIDGAAPIQAAQHKGCSTCRVYETEPGF